MISSTTICVSNGLGRVMQPYTNCNHIWFMQSQNYALLRDDQVCHHCRAWKSADEELSISSGCLWDADVRHSSDCRNVLGRSRWIAKMLTNNAARLLQWWTKLRLIELCDENIADDVPLSSIENTRVDILEEVSLKDDWLPWISVGKLIHGQINSSLRWAITVGQVQREEIATEHHFG